MVVLSSDNNDIRVSSAFISQKQDKMTELGYVEDLVSICTKQEYKAEKDENFLLDLGNEPTMPTEETLQT